MASLPHSDLSQQTTTRPKCDIRDILPAELWLLVKFFIEPLDLITHTSLSRISTPITEILYGNQYKRAAFWEEVCLMNGLGILPGEYPGVVDWEVVAIHAAVHTEFCDHPECGARRLEQNGALLWPQNCKYESLTSVRRLYMTTLS